VADLWWGSEVYAKSCSRDSGCVQPQDAIIGRNTVVALRSVMLVRVTTFTRDARRVLICLNACEGPPSFAIVYASERIVRRTQDSVRDAIISSGFEFPLQRITISVAPASAREATSQFSLAIGLGLLAASAQIPLRVVESCAFYGEISPSGEIRSSSSLQRVAVACRRTGITRLVVAPSGPTLGATTGLEVLEALTLGQVARQLEAAATSAKSASSRRARRPLAILRRSIGRSLP
jgi:predicted ATPase with chaperone activity